MRMASPETILPTLKVKADQNGGMVHDDSRPTDKASQDNPGISAVSHPQLTIVQYLKDNVPVFRELEELRSKVCVICTVHTRYLGSFSDHDEHQGWNSAEGDKFFERQRRQGDETNERAARVFNGMMEAIADEMHRFTGAFKIKSKEEPQRILDLCMSPGTYLSKALRLNPTAHAMAFTLPTSQGGLVPIVKESETVQVNFLDITMLAADMGITSDEIPISHPDAANFFHRRYLDDGRNFDLILCDGAIRRTHERAEYRSRDRESRRLLLTQLSLGLEHLWPGGTMIVLLHQVERVNTIRLLRDFTSFASIVLYKHRNIHAKRSSFYMIATEVRSADQEALQAVQEWKRDWKISTLGTDEEWQDEYARAAGFGDLGVEGLLDDFGPTLVRLGEKMWKIQADALRKAPFMKK